MHIPKFLFEFESAYFNSEFFYLNLKIIISNIKNLFEFQNWYLSFKKF